MSWLSSQTGGGKGGVGGGPPPPDHPSAPDSILVLKVGGNELDDPTFIVGLARVVAGLRPLPVLVHGGGKEIGLVQRALGGEPRFVAGLRVTDEAALSAAEVVLCGT